MHQLWNQPWRRTENCCRLLSRQVIYFLIIILRGMMFQLCRCRNTKKLQRIPDEYGGSCKYLSEVTNLFPFKFYQKRMIYYFSAFLQNTAWRTGEGVKCLENMNSNRSWTSSSPAPVSRRVHLTENLRDKLKW